MKHETSQALLAFFRAIAKPNKHTGLDLNLRGGLELADAAFRAIEADETVDQDSTGITDLRVPEVQVRGLPPGSMQTTVEGGALVLTFTPAGNEIAGKRADSLVLDDPITSPQA